MAMVNSRDVKQIMSFPYGSGDPATAAAFDDGLVYALVFWELMSPGFLEMFGTRDPLHSRRTDRAAREIEYVRKDGKPIAFDLQGQDRPIGSFPKAQVP